MRSIAVPMLMLGMCSLLSADTISILYETRPYTAGTALANAAAYVSNWTTLITTDPTPPAGYGSANVSSFVNLNNSGTFSGGSSQDIAFHTVISLTVSPSQAGPWSFQFGIDYGLGGVALLDGSVLDFKTTDMWWNGSLLDTSQYLLGTSSLSTGAHTIELFGLEACCDGQTTGQYQVGTSNFQSFAVPPPAIPEPSSVATMLSGLGFVAFLARGRRNKR